MDRCRYLSFVEVESSKIDPSTSFLALRAVSRLTPKRSARIFSGIALRLSDRDDFFGQLIANSSCRVLAFTGPGPAFGSRGFPRQRYEAGIGRSREPLPRSSTLRWLSFRSRAHVSYRRYVRSRIAQKPA